MNRNIDIENSNNDDGQEDIDIDIENSNNDDGQEEGKPLDLSEDCALLHCTEVTR